MDSVTPASTRHLELGIAATVIVLDQITKAAVRGTLSLNEHVNIIPGLLDITHVRNTGAAFGILNAAEFPLKSTVIMVIAAGALIAIASYAARLAAHDMMARVGLALILGGAIGNLIDRALAGYVVDFVDVYWRDYHFWAFNAADSAITIGAAVMILDMLGMGRNVSKTV